MKSFTLVLSTLIGLSVTVAQGLGTPCEYDFNCDVGFGCASGECGGVGSLVEDCPDGAQACATSYCTTGFQIDGACSYLSLTGVGGDCIIDLQCDQGSCSRTGICGGDGAVASPCPSGEQSCYSSECASGFQRGNVCARLPEVGDPCSSGAGCPSLSGCSAAGICGGLGASVQPCREAYACITPHCISGFQVGGICTNLDRVNIGDTCFVDQQCPNFSCYGGVCGGLGTPVWGCDNGLPVCANENCASGFQVNGECAIPTRGVLGEFCAIDAQCPIGVACQDEHCGGLGRCTPSDPTQTSGTSEACPPDSLCINTNCYTNLALGQQCTSGTDLECEGPCYGGICQPSENCVSNDDCGSLGSRNTCGSDARCGGIEASCNPDVYVYDFTGYSSQCTSQRGLSCYYGQCQPIGNLGIGASCLPETQAGRCSPELHCVSGTCRQYIPLDNGSPCEVSEQCGTDSTCSDNICVSLDVGPSARPRRRDMVPWLRARCTKPGEIACPLKNSGHNKMAYEVGRANPR